MPDLNYYEILGVAPSADTKQIRKAYRKMAELHHPDKLKSADPKLRELATEEMILINEAKDILLDESERRKYDLRLKRGTFGTEREGKENALVRTIVQTQNILTSIRESGVDIKEAEQYFFQAKYAFQNRYYRNGLELLEYAVKTARDAHYQYTVEQILEARKHILSVEKEGYNVDSSKNILMQAKPAIEKGNYKQATEFAKGAIESAKRIKEIKEIEKKQRKRKRTTPPGRTATTGVWGGDADIGAKRKRPGRRKGIREFIERLSDDEVMELKDIILERVHQIELKEQLKKDMKKLNVALDHKEDMLRFQRDTDMEKEIIREIEDKYGEEEEEVVDFDLDFDLDLDDIEYIGEEDIPEEDRDIISVDWNETAEEGKGFVYKAVLEEAWADGIVTDDEDAMLKRLRKSLALSEDDHVKMEKQIVDRLLLDDYV